MTTKLHEVLAAEKTPTAAWNTMIADTLKKFGGVDHFFSGYSKSLKMIENTPANEAIEAAAREEKAVPTNVFDTLDYALGIFANSENLQYQKNATNRVATADVMWQGQVLLTDMPVDELLGLEARLVKIKELMVAMPTLDAAVHWVKNDQLGAHVWETVHPVVQSKTEKVMTPVVMAPATDKHPAQVQAVTKDNVVGSFTQIKRSGAVTAVQKSEAIKRIDELMVEVKQARMRANETPVVNGVKVGDVIADLLLFPLK